MTVQSEIKQHIAALPESRRSDLEQAHKLIRAVAPKAKLWFSDGRDDKGKVVANPTIGYGQFTITYADGSSKEWFRVGLSANASGISIYILGLSDKTLLAQKFGKTIGKASISGGGYCIRFKALKDVNAQVLHQAVDWALTLKGKPAASKTAKRAAR